MDFSFTKAIKDSWFVVWKNKILILLAVFISQARLMVFFNFESTAQVISSGPGMWWETIKFYFNQGFSTNMVLFLLVVLSLLFGFLSLLSRGGLVYGLLKAEKKQPIKFVDQLKQGLEKWVPLLLVEVVLYLPVLAFILIFLLLSILSVENTPMIGLYSTIFIILILIYKLFLALVRYYIYYELLVSNKKPFDAVVSGLKIFVKNSKETFLLGLLRFVMTIGAFIITGFAALVAVIPFILLVAIAAIGGSGTLPLIIGFFGLAVAIVVVFVVKGMKVSYFYSMMYQAYKQLDK